MPFAFVNCSKRTWPYSGRKHDFTCFYFPVITGISLSTRPLEQKLTWFLLLVFNRIYSIYTPRMKELPLYTFKMHWNPKSFARQFGLCFSLLNLWGVASLFTKNPKKSQNQTTEQKPKAKTTLLHTSNIFLNGLTCLGSYG